MKPNPIGRTFSGTIVLAALSALAGATLVQAAPPAAPATPAAAPAAAPVGEGLAGLDDNALAAELSSRGLTSLLDHYFKVNHTSETQQQAIKTFGALRELHSKDAAISVGEKMRRVKDVAEGIDHVLPSLKDPMEMISTAGTLVEFGVNSDINDIEYWGEDPVTQASLKPLADAVVKLLDTAATTARKQADALAPLIRGPNDPNADRWDNLDKTAAMAAYSKHMAVYFAAAARAPKDPERAKLSADGIKSLADYDNDQFGVQPRVRNMIGKLEMISGDYPKAKATLATVIDGKTLVPPANPYEENEARRYTVLCDLLGRDVAAAKADLAALQAWQTDTEPKALADLKVDAASIAVGAKANAAAGMMLNWRIDMLESELAKSAADKTNAEHAADDVLGKLREAHPEMGPRIDQQLVKRLAADPKIKIDAKMPGSVLVALEKRGLAESYKTPDEKPDVTVIKKGIEAAQAIVARKVGPGLTAADVEEAQLSIAQLQNHLGDKVAAANAFLDYAVANYTKNPNKATQAFDAAGYLVLGVMKRMPTPPTGFAEVYARFLPIAINPPYSHTDLAYEYAEQLRTLSKFAEALKYYRMVPKTNPQAYDLAKYKEMLTLRNLLDTKQEPADHQQTVVALLAVAEEVKKLNETPSSDYFRNCALDAIGTLAELYTRELKDPNRALKSLEGYETLVAGMGAGKTTQEIAAKDALKALIRGAQVLRIKAYMALGKSDEAVQQVTKLLQTAKGDDGINFVKLLLDKLNKDYVAADLVHNTAVMKESAKNSALLTGYLVKYSDPATQKDPNVSQYYYAYVAYDATAQRIAGSLVDDPAASKKLLEAAADRFRFLQTDAMHKLYIEQPEIKKRVAAGLDPTDPDWQVQTGLALTDFDLGNFKEARDMLNPIIALKKLGTGQIETVDTATGQVTVKANDLYWEAFYKLLKSDYEVGATEAQVRADGIKMLKGILLLGGIPDRWQDEFESLRKEAIPDFNPDKPVVQKPAAPAATAPAASAAK